MIFMFSDSMLSDSMLSFMLSADSMLSTREKYSGRKYRLHKLAERDPMKYLIIRKSQQLIINGAILSGWVHAGGDC